jgi:hypothetical protein
MKRTNCVRQAARLAVCLSNVVAHPLVSAAVQPSDTPESRAIAYLAVEVPKWARENGCYSCHNNGDAARALLLARRTGDLPNSQPLADTLSFLAAPAGWDANGPEGPFKDKRLARIQFAGALAEAARAGALTDRKALAEAAALVAELQSAEGDWEIDAAAAAGSPVTYGRALATAMALQTIRSADAGNYRAAIDKAQVWFERRKLENVLDSASALLALADRATDAGQAQRARAVELIRRGESPHGGWGPFVNSPPEVFDTAVVLIALAAQKDRKPLAPSIARGRGYLLAAQQADGGWPATTRPRGVDSYAQQISTSAWATQALLVTRKPR